MTKSVALRVVVLFGIVMMHGASRDHLMAMPAQSASMSSSTDAPYFASGPATSDAAMTHAECVVTLPHQAGHTQPPSGLMSVFASTENPCLVLVSATAVDVRGPPAPSLIRLCISRT